MSWGRDVPGRIGVAAGASWSVQAALRVPCVLSATARPRPAGFHPGFRSTPGRGMGPRGAAA